MCRPGGSVLGYIGEDQAGCRGHGPGVLDGSAGQQFQKAALAAAVSPVQEDPLSLPDVEGYRRTDGLSVIEDGHLGKRGKGVRMVFQWIDLQGFRSLCVFQQAGFLKEGLLLPLFYGFGTLHHLCRFVPHIALVSRANLGGFHPVGPDGGAPGGLLQAADVLFQPLVRCQFKFLLAAEILHPGGKIPALDVDGRPVERQDVVHTSVQEPRSWDTRINPFFFFRYRETFSLAAASRWLVGSSIRRKCPWFRKRAARSVFGLFPVGKSLKGSPQYLCIHVQKG